MIQETGKLLTIIDVLAQGTLYHTLTRTTDGPTRLTTFAKSVRSYLERGIVCGSLRNEGVKDNFIYANRLLSQNPDYFFDSVINYPLALAGWSLTFVIDEDTLRYDNPQTSNLIWRGWENDFLLSEKIASGHVIDLKVINPNYFSGMIVGVGDYHLGRKLFEKQRYVTKSTVDETFDEMIRLQRDFAIKCQEDEPHLERLVLRAVKVMEQSSFGRENLIPIYDLKGNLRYPIFMSHDSIVAKITNH